MFQSCLPVVQFELIRYVTSAAIEARIDQDQNDDDACDCRGTERDHEHLPSPLFCVRFARVYSQIAQQH